MHDDNMFIMMFIHNTSQITTMSSSARRPRGFDDEGREAGAAGRGAEPLCLPAQGPPVWRSHCGRGGGSLGESVGGGREGGIGSTCHFGSSKAGPQPKQAILPPDSLCASFPFFHTQGLESRIAISAQDEATRKLVRTPIGGGGGSGRGFLGIPLTQGGGRRELSRHLVVQKLHTNTSNHNNTTGRKGDNLTNSHDDKIIREIS